MKEQPIVIWTTAPHPNGGSENLWMSAAKVLLREKRAVHAFIPRWTNYPETLKELIQAGLQLEKMPVPTLGDRIRLKLAHRLDPDSPLILSGSLRLWRRLTELTDVPVFVNANNLPESMALLFALHRAKRNYACLYQLISENDWPSDKRLEKLRGALMKAEAVYFVSQQNREILERMLNCPLANASVIRNESRLQSHGVQPWPDEAVRRIAFVGRISFFHKGLDLLLRVLERSEWRTRAVEFHLFGAGEQSDCARRWIERAGLKNVFLRGHQKDALAIWQSSHAMILPSRMEGFSLTLAEAMSCGRVPIATAVGDAGTVIQDGVNGFLAGSASEEAIGAALERAWSERARWRELGLAAAQFRPTEGGKSSGEILADSLIKLQR